MVGIQVSQVIQVKNKEEKNEVINRLFFSKDKEQIKQVRNNLSKTPKINIQRSSYFER